MRISILNAVRGYFRFSNRWLFRTPERALEEAYEAALTIRAIEEQHFGGNKITAANAYGDSVRTYFQEELNRCLNVIKIRLAEFRISRAILQFSTTRPITEIELNNPQEGGDVGRIEVIDRPAIILRKLRYIDEVFSRYTAQTSPQSAVIPVVDANQLANTSPNGGIDRLQSDPFKSNLSTAEAKIATDDIESIVDKTGVLPRSILKTVDRIKRELDPNAEQEVVENFRSSKARTIVSLRLVLLFIVVPLLTQQVSKIVLVGPIVDHFRNNETVEIFLNEEMEQEAFQALNRYEEQLKFQMLVGKIEPMTEEALEENLKERAEELATEYQVASNDAVKNVFADIMAVVAFILLALSSKREIAVLKSFLDELVYGLSDSAKAFIIILLTDTFVGFHSPHGWEVLLEGASRHLGLPANRDFIFLFIATFPVILDTIFKYWIFRYLNRISPSAVATYRNMNE